jgi:hypothetical protein
LAIAIDAGCSRSSPQQHAARGAARAEHEHSLAVDRAAEPFQIRDQAGAVGVVGVDLLAFEFQRVDRPRLLGTLAALGREREGFQLERNGDVEPLAARCTEGSNGRGKAVARGKHRLVAQILMELACELGMNAR